MLEVDEGFMFERYVFLVLKLHIFACTDVSKIGPVVQRTGALFNQRRCAARARHKIRGFVKALRRMSGNESEGGSDNLAP